MSWVHINAPAIYTFEGWTFEFSYGSGPWPLKKDGELRKRCGRRFYAVFSKWYALPHNKREKFRIGGGCRFIQLGK